MKRKRFDPAPVLAGLKDFQRRTVERVFDRMYRDDPPGRRFLVADEVGLGKTMVARGVIARVLEHLHEKVDRIDVVYVCSNGAIAAQNVNRLNVLGEQEFSIATRLTMLPTQVHDLASRPINFVSFTPGTTFDLKSRSGRAHERAILCRLLADEELFHRRGLRNLLRNGVGRRRWENLLTRNEELDPGIHERFVRRVRRDRRLRRKLERLTDHFSDGRRGVTREIQRRRLAVIGELRHVLASVCVDALEPDLVILDEFQRFRDLLDGKSEAARLARALFDYQDVRVLLLSATPYKMLSLDHEREDDHYPDFLRTLGFLLGSDEAVDEVKEDITLYRRALYAGAEEAQSDRIAKARRALEGHLRGVMCRTERVATTRSLDSMLAEPPRPAPLESTDLRQAKLADRLSQAVRAPDVIEYWKSRSLPAELHAQLQAARAARRGRRGSSRGGASGARRDCRCDPRARLPRFLRGDRSRQRATSLPVRGHDRSRALALAVDATVDAVQRAGRWLSRRGRRNQVARLLLLEPRA